MTGKEIPRKILMPSSHHVDRAIKPSTSATKCQQIAGLYDLEETLGKGHFAIVKAARHVFTGERVAVKVIDKSKLDVMSQKALIQEVVCMKLVQHTNIIKLYEIIDTSSKMYLILELGQGDLYDLIIRQQGGLGEEVSRKYFQQIISAVSYCHRLHVVHRDLKPENIVHFPNANGPAGGPGIVKLTDFGFSNRFSPGIKLETSCGSLAYSAPEILLGDSYDPPAVDIWSLGIILYMLVVGRVPFQEANDSETLIMIMDVKYNIPPNISKECCNLIKSMLQRYPENRNKLEGIESDPWLNQDDYLEKQSQISPLITDYHLTSNEKNTIIQQMINGAIGVTRDEILDAIEKNAYNHITSTFYLLAEKYIKENELQLTHQSGINSTLTSSLESIHDTKNRKNSSSHSGPSDTDEFNSGCEEDTLAPLDLEMKNSTTTTSSSVAKKSFRLHTTHSSSALSEMDKTQTLPILEEDVTSNYSEEEDSAGPLVLSTTQQRYQQQQQPRRPHHQPGMYRRSNHVMLQQRSTSCSSSEDEDSEKKKATRPGAGFKHKHLTKSSQNPGGGGGGGGGGSSRGDCRFNEIKKFFDDESSDEPHGASGGGGVGTSFQPRLSTTTEGQQQQQQQQQQTETTTTTMTTTAQLCQVKIIGIDEDEVYNESTTTKRYLSISKSNDYLDQKCHGSCHDNEDGSELLGFSTTNGLLGVHDYGLEEALTLNNHPSCSSKTTSKTTTTSTTSSSPLSNSGFSLAKKGKKLFLNWFFFKNRGSSNSTSLKSKDHQQSLSPSNIPSCSGSNRIYKTKSCSELKIKNVNVGTSTTGTTAKATTPSSERDVNQNL